MALSNNLALACYDDVGSEATFTSTTTAETGFPLSNLQNPRLWSRCRLPATTVQIDVDLGSAQALNTFALLGTKLTAAATRRFRLSTVSDFASTVIDTGAVEDAAFDASLGSLLDSTPPWGRHLIYAHDSDQTGRYLRWNITDSGNADGYIELAIGRAGLAWQPGADFFEEWQQQDKIVGEPGNEKILRGHAFELRNLSESEAAKVASLLRAILSTSRLLVLTNPLNASTFTSQAIWGTAEKPLEVRPLGGIGRKVGLGARFSIEMAFREVDE